MVDITKTFGKVVANDRVHLDIYPGEILSLLGETSYVLPRTPLTLGSA